MCVFPWVKSCKLNDCNSTPKTYLWVIAEELAVPIVVVTIVRTTKMVVRVLSLFSDVAPLPTSKQTYLKQNKIFRKYFSFC